MLYATHCGVNCRIIIGYSLWPTEYKVMWCSQTEAKSTSSSFKFKLPFSFRLMAFEKIEDRLRKPWLDVMKKEIVIVTRIQKGFIHMSCFEVHIRMPFQMTRLTFYRHLMHTLLRYTLRHNISIIVLVRFSYRVLDTVLLHPIRSSCDWVWPLAYYQTWFAEVMLWRSLILCC